MYSPLSLELIVIFVSTFSVDFSNCIKYDADGDATSYESSSFVLRFVIVGFEMVFEKLKILKVISIGGEVLA